MKFKYQAFKKTVFAALFLMLNLAFSFKGNAQNISDFIFEKYSIKNGLSQSSSICLFQDKLGYIWVGTQQGIDRFDGYTFKQYSHDIKNDFSRSAGWVIDIQEDEKGNIWTSDTYGNISLLNKINDRWENIILPIRDSLFKINNKLPARLGVGASIYFDSKNNSLWIGSNGTGLIEYKIQSKKFKQYLVHPNDPIKFGKQEIILRPTTPKNMIGAGTKAGLILHALRQIGKDNVTIEMIQQIRSQLEEKDIKHIKKQVTFAPAWIAKIMRSLVQ